MNERRIMLRTDDDSTIEIRWEPGAKFVLEVNDSSAGTAKQEPVSPESPGSTAPAEGTTVLEQQRLFSGRADV